MTEGEHRDYTEQEVQERFESIGKTMAASGLYAEAIEAYKDLIREFPGSRWAANAYLAIAQCYHALGQEEDELGALEDIIRQFPDHVVAKRAQGAVSALRERRYGEGAAGADLHGAVRRLTRQVERMRQGQGRRAWVGAVTCAGLLGVFIWFAVRASGGPPVATIDELNKRVTALESAVQALQGPAGPKPSAAPAQMPIPSVTVTPVEPQVEPKPQPPKPVTPAPSPTGKPPRPRPAQTPPVKKPAPTPAPAKAPTRAYTVEPGDSLWTIARAQLGDGRRVDEIARLNGLEPPYKIKAGQKLKLPIRR